MPVYGDRALSDDGCSSLDDHLRGGASVYQALPLPEASLWTHSSTTHANGKPPGLANTHTLTISDAFSICEGEGVSN